MLRERLNSLESTTQVTVFTFGVFIILSVVAVISDLFQLSLLENIQAGVSIGEGEADSNDTRQQVIGVVQVLALVATAIAFCSWAYRAYDILPHLGYENRMYTSGWAVGAYFVPILNLFRPYQIMKETWRASQPDLEDGGPKEDDTYPLLGVWWGLWLISNVLDRATMTAAKNSDTVEQLIGLTWVYIVADAAGTLSAILTLLVVRRISEAQQRKGRLILDRVVWLEP